MILHDKARQKFKLNGIKKKNLAIVIQTYFKKIFRIIVDFNQPNFFTMFIEGKV